LRIRTRPPVGAIRNKEKNHGSEEKEHQEIEKSQED